MIIVRKVMCSMRLLSIILLILQMSALGVWSTLLDDRRLSLAHRKLYDNHVEIVDGLLIRSANGKEIFCILNGTRHSIPDFDTFVKYKFNKKNVKSVHELILEQIPLGSPLPSLIGNDEPVVPIAPSTESHAHVNKHFLRGDQKRHSHKHGLHTRAHDERSHTSTEINVPSASGTMYSTLDDFSHQLEATKVACYSDDFSEARDSLFNNIHKSIIKDVPVIVYPMCLRTFQLGNSLGYYFNDLACADVAGAHFLGVNKQFEILDPLHLATTGDAQYAFFDALPDLVEHEKPIESHDAIKKSLREHCKCAKYCWQDSSAAWIKRIDLIGNYLRHAIHSYLSVANISNGMILDAADMSSQPVGTFLPVVPNVTVQYRCGDNIGFGKTHYGLLPFPAIVSRIPQSSQYIYVIADSPSRASTHPYASRCGIILTALFDTIRAKFPHAVVVIKRGGDVFLDVARLALASTVICSASTFCLWPALANLGEAYFPLTPLVAGAETNITAPQLSPRFHWITEVYMVKEFKQFHPWEQVIDVLKTKRVEESY